MKPHSPRRMRYAPHTAAVGLVAAGLVAAVSAPSSADQFDIPNSPPEVTINTSTLAIQPDQNGTSRNNGGGDANDKGTYTIDVTVSDVDKLADLNNVTLCLYRVTSQGDSACAAGNLDARDTMLMRWVRSTDSFSIDADGTNQTAITSLATGNANNLSYWRLGHKVTPSETTSSAADTFSTTLCTDTTAPMPYPVYYGGCGNAISPFTGAANGAPAADPPNIIESTSMPVNIPKGFGSFAASTDTAPGANIAGDSQDAADWSFSDYAAGDTSMSMKWRFHASEAAREGAWGVRVIATDSASATDDESDTTGYSVNYYGAIETGRTSVDFGSVLAGETSANGTGTEVGENHSAGFIQANGGTDIEYQLSGATWAASGGSAPTVATGTVGEAIAGNAVALECDANSLFDSGTGHAGVRIPQSAPVEVETEQFLATTTSTDSPGQVSEDYANQSSTAADRSTQSCRLMVGGAVTKANDYSNTVTVSLTEGAAAAQ